MKGKFVEYNAEGRVGYITLNRPDKRNALNYEMVNELKEAFRKASSDSAARIVILKANGDAFCAGADLAYLESLQTNTFDENLGDSQNLMELFQMVYSFNKLVVAQVEGHAIAGGCGLATVCDFVFSVPRAKMGYTEVKIGFIPAIVSVFLIRKLGEAKARELLLTGKLISAQEAKDMGLIYEVVEPELIVQRVKEFALDVNKSTSAQSINMTKLLISRLQHLDIKDGLELAAHMNAEARESEDCKRGIRSFLQKESIVW